MSKKNSAKNTGTGKDKAEGNKTIALNRSARHDYHLESRFEAGIAHELRVVDGGHEFPVVRSVLPSLLDFMHTALTRQSAGGTP